jgi:molybdate transport system substrate-binding protein
MRSSLCLLASAAFSAASMSPVVASAASVNVAVAANFTDAAKEIATAFKAKTGDDAVLTFGSSGQFYTQIKQGAPFQILLSADIDRPKKLAAEGAADKASEFTYAIGKLVLWSKTPAYVKGAETLKSGAFSKISIADPAAAPYGTAAIETMKALDVYDTLKPKVVQGSSIAQAYQFVATGNAELGFVALSQVMKPGGSRWMVPQNLYTPIKQDAIILDNGKSNPTAQEFMTFLKGPEATATIKKFGYVIATAG